MYEGVERCSAHRVLWPSLLRDRKGNFRSFRNKENIREINEFKIRCLHGEKGCEWVGELGALKDHLESDKGCAYVKVQCTNKAYSVSFRSHVTCRATMERCHLANHQENECVYRQYTCEYCGYVNTYDNIAGSGKIWNSRSIISNPKNHLSECPEYPLDCPNGCGEKNIKRKDMNAHRGSCPLEPLECPFKYVGCTAVVRKDKNSHCQENMQEHLLLVVQSHQQLVQLHQQLIHNNEELEEKNVILARKVNELHTNI